MGKGAWIAAALWVLLNAEPRPPSGPLGSTKFVATPEKPLGWRGDGTGRYPGATPPTIWERRKAGNTYAARGILYASPMPSWAVSCPIVVGNRIYLTSEPWDLVCVDKNSGQILWIRSFAPFEGLTPEQKKAAPGVDEKLTPLLAQLAKANEDAVEALNKALPTAVTAGAKTLPALEKKRAVEKQINEAQNAVDKKLFSLNWAQAVFGYAGQTPTSDGKRVCAFFTTGITACLDLDGNRKWIARGEGGGSEHGNFASPLLLGNRLVVWANEMRAYDVETGKLAWTTPAKSFNTYGSLFRVVAGGELVAGFQSGWFVRVRDGAPIWGGQSFGDAVSTPIVESGYIFARQGYPINSDETKGFKAFKIPASADSQNKPAVSHTFKMDWAETEMVIDKKKNPFDRSFVASPLFVDGLIYQITEGGGLLVNDAATGELVYRKVLTLKPKTEYWSWAGTSASPTLAGKHIYLMDNQGTTIVLQPGRQYKEVAVNVLEESKDGKTQEQNVSTPVFEGNRMYYRTPGFLFCIGSP